MKKRKFLITSSTLLLAATTIAVACKAPGSSEELPRGGKEFYQKPVLIPNTQLPQQPVQPPKSTLSNVNILGDQKFDHIDEAKRKKSEHFIPANEDIRYVAIGDSITEGFDGTLPQSYPGQLESDGSISGVSYPAYLARLLNQNHRVKAFNNFAVSGSRLLDWIKLLGIPYDDSLVKDEDTLSIFGNDWQAKTQQIKDKLQQANLVTFSLSANDILFLLFQNLATDDVTNLIKNYLKGQAIISDAVVLINKLFNNALRETQKRLTTFVANLKQFAPNANINFIGYPTPMLLIANVIKEYVAKLFGGSLDFSPLDILVNVLNKGIRETAIINKINFIQPVNNDYWNKHASELSTIFFDIHPNTFGYKKMAMDIYLKITNPSLNINDYKGYDFSQEYLDFDANSATYQIQPIIPNSQLFGPNTASYLDVENNYEQEIDDKRDIYNFGNRIAELTETFSYLTREAFDFLTNNSIYNVLDPERKLAKLFNKKVASGKFAKDSLVESLLRSNTLQRILYNLQTQLQEYQEQNQLTLDNVSAAFKYSILNIDNLAIVISAVASSDMVKEYKTEFADALKTILNNAIKVFGPNVKSAVMNAILAPIKKYNVKESDISSILDSVLNSEHLKELVSAFADSYALHPDNFTDVSNLSDVFSNILKDPQINTRISSHLNALLFEFLTSPKLQAVASEFLYNFLKENNLTANITSDEVNVVINDLIKLLKQLNDNQQLIDKFTSYTLNSFPYYGYNRIGDLFSVALRSLITTEFIGSQNEPKLLDFIKTILNSDLLQHHKAFIKQIISNALDLNTLKGISKSVSNLFANSSIAKYIPTKSLDKLINLVFSQPQILDILKATLDAILNNTAEYNKAQSLNDLIAKAIQHLPIDNLKPQLIAIFNNILTNNELPQIINDVMYTSLATFGIDIKNSDNIKFISDFSQNIIPYIQKQQLINPIIDAFIDKLKAVKTSNEPIKILAQIPDAIFAIIKNKYTTNTITQIKDLLNQKWIKDNSNGVLNTAAVVLNSLQESGVLSNGITSLLSNLLDKPQIAKYVDKNEILQLTLNVINRPQTMKLVVALLESVLKNPDLLDKLSSPKELVSILLKEPKVKEVINKEIKEILLDVINNNDLTKTTAKIIYEVTNANGFALDQKFLPVLNSVYPSALSVLKSLNKLNPLIEQVIELVTTSDDVNSLLSKLPQLISLFDFSDLDLYKLLLNTPLFTTNKELLKELINKVFAKFKDQYASAALDKMLPESVLGLNKTESKTLFDKIIKNTAFNSIFTNFAAFIIDHSQEFVNANSWIDIINLFLKDTNFISSNKESITNIINEYKTDATLKKLLANIISEKIGNLWIFAHTTNKNQLISDLLDYLLSQFDNLKVVEHLFKALDLYQNSRNTNPIKILNLFANEIASEFSSDVISQKVITLIKGLPDNFISNHKNDLKQIFINVYDYFKTDEHLGSKILNLLPQATLAEVNKYTSEQISDQIIYSFLNKESTKNLFKGIVDNILDNIQNLKSINSIKDLLNHVVKSINGEQLKTSLTTWIDEILNDDSLVSNINTILSNVIKFNFVEIYNDPQTHQFLNIFLKEAYSWAKELGIIDLVANNLKTFFDDSESVFDQRVATLKTSLASQLQTKVIENLHNLVKKLYNSDAVKKYPAYTATVANYIFNSLVNNILIFKDIINNALVSNQIIDASQKLSDEQLNQLNPLLKVINNLDSNVSIIDKILAIPVAEINKTTNTNELISLFTNKLLSAIDLNNYAFVKVLLNSEFVQNQHNWLKQIFNKLLDKYWTDANTQALAEKISVDSIETTLGFTKGALRDLIKTILKDSKTKEIIKSLGDSAIDHISSLKAPDSYNQLVKAIFNITGLKDSIKEKVVALIKEFVSKASVKEKLKSLVISLLNKEVLQPYLKGVNDKNKLAENIIKIYDIVDSQLDISELTFEVIYASLQNNGLNFNFTSIANAILNGFKARLNKDNKQEENIIKLLKAVIKSGLFTENKTDIITIITNIITKLGDGSFVDELINNLPTATKTQIQNFIGLSQLSDVAKAMLKNIHFHNLINATFSKIIEHINEFENVTSYNDLFKKLLTVIDINSIKVDLKAFIDDLLQNSDINNSLYELIKNLLVQKGVNVTENEVFIRAFVSNIKDVVHHIGLIDPIIEKVFETLQQAASSTDDVLVKLAQIPNQISQIITEKVFKNPKQYVDSLLATNVIATHKESFIKVVTQLLIHLKNNGYFDKFINSAIDSINNKQILSIISKDDIKQLVKVVLNDTLSTQAIQTFVPELIKNTDWITYLNNPFALFKNLLQNTNIENFVKTSFANGIQNILTNTKVSNILASVLDKWINKLGLNLAGINKISLIHDLISSIIPFLQKINVYQPLINLLTDTFASTDSFAAYAAKLKVEIPKLFVFNDNVLIAALQTFENIKNHKNTVVQIGVALYNSISENDAFVDQMFAYIFKNPNSYTSNGIDVELLKKVIKSLLKNNEIKSRIATLLDNVISRYDVIKNSHNLSELIKNIFNNDDFKNSLKTIGKKLISLFYKNDDIKNLIAKFAIHKLEHSDFAALLTNVSHKEDLVKALLGAIKEVNHYVPVTDLLIDSSVDEVARNGLNFDFNSVLNKLIESFKLFVSSHDYEAKIIDLLNGVVRENGIQQNKNDFIILVENIVKLAIQKVDFGGFIWNAFDAKTQAFITNGFLSQSEFTNLINSALKVDTLKTLITNIAKYYINNVNTFAYSNTFFDVFKKYISVAANESEFKNSIKKLALDGLSSAATKTAIKSVIEKAVSFLNVKKSTNINDFIEAFANDFGNMFNRIGVFDNLADSMVQTIKQVNDFNGFKSKFIANALQTIKVTDFPFIKKVINDHVITQHKVGAKELLVNLVSNLLDDKTKITKVIHDLNLSKVLVEDGVFNDPSVINDTIILALQNKNIRDIINMVIGDFIDRGNDYQIADDWFGAINILFKSPNSKDFKSKFTTWVKETLSNPDPRIAKGLAQVMIAKLRNLGFNLTENKHLTLYQNVISNLMKALVKRPELPIIVNNIYENIKKIQLSKNKDNFAYIKRAFLDGALYMILTNDHKNIDIGKMGSQANLIAFIANSIGDENYLRFLNSLFETSDIQKRGGIYHFIDTLILKKKPVSNSNASGSSNKPSSLNTKKEVPTPYGVVYGGITEIFRNGDKVSDLLGSIFAPIYRQMIVKLSKNQYKIGKDFYKNDEFRLLFRLSAFILWFIHTGAGVTGQPFWNVAGLDVEGYFIGGLWSGFEKAINDPRHKDIFNKLTTDKKVAMGMARGGGFNKEFVLGNRSYSTNIRNYWNDQLLAYIYYDSPTQRDRHTGKLMRQVLEESIARGSLKR
ncbi:SGNH/GDSL hydrolase family protein [Mycoplasma sp. 394]